MLYQRYKQCIYTNNIYIIVYIQYILYCIVLYCTGKSAKVKQYVNQVQHQAKFIGKSREQLQAEEKKKQEREAIKQAKEDAELANSVLFKGMSVGSSGAGGKNNAKVDPKSILCPDFKVCFIEILLLFTMYISYCIDKLT